MAGDSKLLKIVVELNAAGAERALGSLRAALQGLSKGTDAAAIGSREMAAAFDNAATQASVASAAVGRVATVSAEAGAAVSNAAKSLAAMAERTAATSSASGAVSKSFLGLSAAGRAVQAALAATGAAVVRASTALSTYLINAAKRASSALLSLSISGESLKKALFSLKSLFVAIGAVALAKSFVNAAARSESLKTRLIGLFGSITEGTKAFKGLEEVAERLPVKLQDLESSATQFGAVIKGGADETLKWVEMAADISAATGLSIDTTTQALRRMYDGGTEAATMFRRAGILSMLGFQKGVSLSAEETRQHLIAAWEDPASRFRGAAAGAAKTWDGMLTLLGNAWTLFRERLMGAGVFDFIKGLLNELLGGFQNVTKSMADAGSSVKSWASGVIDALKGAMTALAYMYDGWRGAKMLLETLKGAWALLVKAIYESGVGDYMLLFREGILGLNLAFAKVADAATRAFGWITDKIVGIVEELRYFLEVARELGAKFISADMLNRMAKLEVQLRSTSGSAEQLTKELIEGTTAQIAETEKQREAYKKTTAEAAELYNTIAVGAADSLVALASEESAVSKLEATFARIANNQKLAAEETRRQAEEQDALRKRMQEEAAADAARFAALSSAGQREELAAGLKPSDRARAEADLQKQMLAETIAGSEAAYKAGIETWERYWDQRITITKQRGEAERVAFEELIKEEEDPARRVALYDKMRAAEFEHQQELLNMTKTRLEEETRMHEAQFAARQMLRELALSQTPEESRSMFDVQAAELADYEEQLALKLDALKMAREQELITEAEFQDARTAMIVGKETFLAEQQKAIRETVFQAAKTTLDATEQAFGDMYEASGRKAKEFFYAQKALAVVNTIMSTYESAQKAYNSLSNIPYVGPALGAAAAAAAVASGMARVAMIRNQSLAAGGSVEGWSPNDRADNIPAMLTAGEFVHPVSAVKYYGEQAMEAIRRRTVPRSVLAAYSAPSRPPSSRFSFAAGGPVGAGSSASAPSGGKSGGGMTIVNVVDPSQYDQHLQSRPGEEAVLNVMTRRRFAVNKILNEGER